MAHLNGWRIGSESCQHLVPSRGNLDAAAGGRDPARMTLVTSLVEQTGFGRLLDASLAALEAGWGEVVVNDWGLLAELAGQGEGRLTAGRMLTRFRRGPGFSDPWESLDEESRRYFAWGPLYDTGLLDHFRGMGIGRLEADPPPHWHPLPDLGNLRISLHGQHRLVSVCAACPWLFDEDTGAWSCLDPCPRPCLAGGTLQLDNSRLSGPLLLKGREIFQDASGQWEDGGLPDFVDRIITFCSSESGTETAWRTRNRHKNP